MIFNILYFVIGLCSFFIPSILIIKSIYTLIKSENITEKSLLRIILLCGVTAIISLILGISTNLPKIPLIILCLVGFLGLFICSIYRNKVH